MKLFKLFMTFTFIFKLYSCEQRSEKLQLNNIKVVENIKSTDVLACFNRKILKDDIECLFGRKCKNKLSFNYHFKGKDIVRMYTTRHLNYFYNEFNEEIPLKDYHSECLIVKKITYCESRSTNDCFENFNDVVSNLESFSIELYQNKKGNDEYQDEFVNSVDYLDVHEK